MTPDEPSILDASTIKPKTFADLKELTSVPQCRRCSQRTATHTLNMTAAKIGTGRGSTVAQISRTPLCEQCAVEIYAVVKKALKV